MNELINYLKEKYLAKQGTDHDWQFKLDDRQRYDVASDFCDMTLTVEADVSQFTLTLFPVPTSAGLLELVKELDGEIVQRRDNTRIVLKLGINKVTQLRELAKETRRITGRGKTYLNSNWKWICPRTANSLDRFATNLTEFRRARRNGRLGIVEQEDEGLFALADY